jgi:hypothetical protein
MRETRCDDRLFSPAFSSGHDIYEEVTLEVPSFCQRSQTVIARARPCRGPAKSVTRRQVGRSERRIHPTEAFRHEGHQLQRKEGVLLHQKHKALPVDPDKTRVGPHDGRGCARSIFHECHLAEHSARFHGLDGFAADDQIDRSSENCEHVVARFAFAKHRRPSSDRLSLLIFVEKVNIHLRSIKSILVRTRGHYNHTDALSPICNIPAQLIAITPGLSGEKRTTISAKTESRPPVFCVHEQCCVRRCWSSIAVLVTVPEFRVPTIVSIVSNAVTVTS